MTNIGSKGQLRLCGSCPENPGPDNGGICTDLYLQASTAVEHAKTLKYPTEEGISLEGALRIYTIDYRLYRKAENLFQQVLRVKINIYRMNHIKTANMINNLGLMYDSQGKYEEAIA